MKRATTLSTLFVTTAVVGSAHPAVVAQFDLGVTGSDVAAGFEEVSVGLNSDNLTSVSGTQNGVTITVFANTVLDARNRGVNSLYTNATLNPGSDPDPNAGALTPMLYDWLFDNGNSQGEQMSVQFTGLAANTDYTITSVHFETSGGQVLFQTDWYRDLIAPANLLGTWNGERGTTLAASDFVELSVTSDANGEVNLIANAVTGPLRLNGFLVDQVPEPGSIALLAMGGLLLTRRRRGK